MTILSVSGHCDVKQWLLIDFDKWPQDRIVDGESTERSSLRMELFSELQDWSVSDSWRGGAFGRFRPILFLPVLMTAWLWFLELYQRWSDGIRASLNTSKLAVLMETQTWFLVNSGLLQVFLNFQSSEKVDFDSFCQCSQCFYRGIHFGGPCSAILEVLLL